MRAESTKVRLSKEAARRRAIKEQKRQQQQQALLANGGVPGGSYPDERETRVSGRGSSSNLNGTIQQHSGSGKSRPSRRDRIAPEGPRRMSAAAAKQLEQASNGVSSSSNNNNALTSDSPRSKRRKSKSKKNLKVDVNLDPKGDWSQQHNTPNTAASSPSLTPGVRGDGDYRSPGARKTPKVASEDHQQQAAAVPDFITQTDRFGNASTPRSQTAIQKARQLHPDAPKPHLHVGRDGKLHDDDDKSVDACAETFLDSLRLMCCCLMPDDDSTSSSTPPGASAPRGKKHGKQGQMVVKSQVTEEDVLPDEEVERPRLLPKIHPDDNGKKCLVLDLDETLVHSSFRAVPGADFVIPVQVRWKRYPVGSFKDYISLSTSYSDTRTTSSSFLLQKPKTD